MRQPRAFVAGYPVHVVHRGNNRQDIFRCEFDFRYFWRCLKEASPACGLAVNAYVFMTNHVHLLVTPEEPGSISKAIHSAARRYSSYFNSRYARTGTLYEGRYRAAMVTRDSYFLACHRYIDMNPVRAGLVARPADYEWSSHRFYSHGESNSLITPHPAIQQLGLDSGDRRRAYRALFDTPLEEKTLEAIRSCTQSCRALGDRARKGRPPKK